MFWASVIIPLKTEETLATEVVTSILDSANSGVQFIILPDFEAPSIKTGHGVTVHPTGPLSPGRKRDVGASLAQSEWLIFMDDDAYFGDDYIDVLKRCVMEGGNAFCGPAIDPPKGMGFWARLSGLFYAVANGNKVRRRYTREVVQNSAARVDDWPTVNLIVSKSCFRSVNGFDVDFWPGEDTWLCEKLISASYSINYVPDLIVFHYRRNSVGRHFKQVGNYAFYRGAFFRKGLSNSRKLKYLVPLSLPVSVVGSVVGSDNITLTFSIMVHSVYFAHLLKSFASRTMKDQNFLSAIIFFPFAYASHLWYGSNFFRGLIFTPQVIMAKKL